MRIAVATGGSEGDVRPYVALTKRLRREGERIRAEAGTGRAVEAIRRVRI